MTDGSDERLTRMEAHLAHVERLCEELNTVVTGQAKELDRLRKLAARLADSLESIEVERVKATNARPPHYQ